MNRQPVADQAVDDAHTRRSGDGPAVDDAHTRLEGWWHEVGVAALVGTGRRPVPALPDLGVPGLRLALAAPPGTSADPAGSVDPADRADPGGPVDLPNRTSIDVVGTRDRVGGESLRAEEALLASAALGGAARRAGRVLDRAATPDRAPDDTHPPAPARAVQLLELLLTQPPVGAQHRDALVRLWLARADEARRRSPHALLPTLLELGTTRAALRDPIRAVLDARGTWLAAQRADWAWAAEAVDHSEEVAIPLADWARLPSADRIRTLATLRADAPDTARTLVESTWATDSAKDRRAHLEALRIALGPDDEPLLERALDDRAQTVREAALDLLDALPTSARAERMAERLRPLIEPKGLLRRTLEVTLPDEPDPAGVRDGLGKPPPRRSARGWWLERLAAGAPLEVWTTASGADAATTLSRLSDEDALSGIRQAVALRRDAAWAAAYLREKDWRATLLAAIPRAERESLILARLRVPGDRVAQTSALLGEAAQPWSPAFSAAAVATLRGSKQAPALVQLALPHLLAGLHPSALGAVEDWLTDVRPDTDVARTLGTILTYHSTARSIAEAFT